MHDVIAFEIELSLVRNINCSCVKSVIDLSQIMTPPHERRNFSKIYEKMKLSQLSAMVPDFNFTQYLGKPSSDNDNFTAENQKVSFP